MQARGSSWLGGGDRRLMDRGRASPRQGPVRRIARDRCGPATASASAGCTGTSLVCALRDVGGHPDDPRVRGGRGSRAALSSRIPSVPVETASDPFDPAAAQGIHRLAIPTPFAVGRVNTYLIEDDPLTLVDSGPNSGRALDELQMRLRDHGHAIEDIELILVTHQHIDHIGLVEIIASHSKAEVAAIDAAVPFVENYSKAAAEDDRFAMDLMIRHGIPEEVARALGSVSAAFRGWGAKARITRVLRDGETLEFRDRTLKVHFRPGHSPTDTVFEDQERKTLLAADHLIAHISSNPLISRPQDGGDRPQALVTYLESLRKTRAMDLDLVLPGHGDPITDHRTLIDE